jgi:hypothetical protein
VSKHGVNSGGNPDPSSAKAGNYPNPWIPVFTGMTSFNLEE